jgi:hypothetical protein
MTVGPPQHGQSRRTSEYWKHALAAFNNLGYSSDLAAKTSIVTFRPMLSPMIRRR